MLVEEGRRDVQELLDWGTRFDRDADGELSRGREAAHSVRRVLHAGDATGREIARLLWTRVSSFTSVEIANHALVTELLVEHDRCVGVRFYDQFGFRAMRGESDAARDGGAGQVFRHTTNPAWPPATASRWAFTPGACRGPRVRAVSSDRAERAGSAAIPDLGSAARDGARLVNSRGEAFMTRYHQDGDLAPRDVVARSIMREMEATGGSVFLSLSHLDPQYVVSRFPTIADMCRQIRLDLARDPVPVSPAAHYGMGGVQTDVWGRTSLKGLFAAGEVACTGVHGANRLASNSLLEGLVFGARAAIAMQDPPAAAALGVDRRLAAARTPNPEPRTSSRGS